MNIGRQKFSMHRSASILVIFSLVSLLVAFSTRFAFNLLLPQVAGLLVGAAIGAIGLKLTAFEEVAPNCYYTPNSYLGISVSLVLIARIAYRFVVLASIDPTAPPPAAGLGQSPLTVALFGLTSGYYISYHAGLLGKRRGLRSAPAKVG